MTERASGVTVEKVMGLVELIRGCFGYATGPEVLRRESIVTALERAITELCAERDRWKQHHKELVNDFLPDNECLPTCDSYGHADECPVYNAQAASRKLIADRDSLRSRNAELEREISGLRARSDFFVGGCE